MNRHFDAIVIGAGQAGPPMVGRLAGAGQKVALIERNLIGGTCVNTGCTPTKTLVASAYAAHLARRGADFGVKARHGRVGPGTQHYNVSRRNWPIPVSVGGCAKASGDVV